MMIMPEDKTAEQTAKQEEAKTVPVEAQEQAARKKPAARRPRPAQIQSAAVGTETQDNPEALQEKQAKSKPKPSGRSTSPRDHLLFGKYSYTDITIGDESFSNYINLVKVKYPNIYGRRGNAAYYNSHISIVERLVNKLMRGGTGRKIGGRVIRTEGGLQGKKLKLTRIVEDSFAIIKKNTGKNPLQVLVVL